MDPTNEMILGTELARLLRAVHDANPAALVGTGWRFDEVNGTFEKGEPTDRLFSVNAVDGGYVWYSQKAVDYTPGDGPTHSTIDVVADASGQLTTKKPRK